MCIKNIISWYYFGYFFVGVFCEDSSNDNLMITSSAKRLCVSANNVPHIYSVLHKKKQTLAEFHSTHGPIIKWPYSFVHLGLLNKAFRLSDKLSGLIFCFFL